MAVIIDNFVWECVAGGIVECDDEAVEREHAAGLLEGQAVGGDFTWRLLMTRTTPETVAASLCASAETLSFGTSPASVTTPLVTLMSMFTMFEKRSTVSFALTAA